MSAQLDQLTAQAANDPDALETKEWLDALEAVIEQVVRPRLAYLSEIVGAILRRPTDDPVVRQCVWSVQADRKSVV